MTPPETMEGEGDWQLSLSVAAREERKLPIGCCQRQWLPKISYKILLLEDGEQTSILYWRF